MTRAIERGATMNRKRSTGLAALMVVLSASAAPGQLPGPSPSGVRDRAKMFSADAVAKADRMLRDAERGGDSHWETVVETRASLANRDIAAVAAAEAEKSAIRGIYVLIARDEKKVQVAPGEAARDVFSAAERARIVEAFTRAFKKGDFDAGLLDASAEVRRAALGFGVRDQARMFSPEAVAKADATLEAVRAKTKRQVVVVTVPTLEGKRASDLAAKAAKALNLQGLYVLIAQKEHATFVEPGGTAKSAFPAERTRPINDALTTAFKAKDYDKGLLDAVALIAKEASADAPVAKSGLKPTMSDLVADVPVSPARRLRAEGQTSTRTVGTESSPSKPEASAPTPPAPAPGPSPQPPTPAAEAPELQGSNLVPLVIGGLGVVFLLWMVSRLFRRPPAPQQPMGQPNVSTAYGPGPGQGPRQGPGPGYQPGQAPPPGYGPPPAPGYGYGPPPAAGGGGGVMQGVLGGVGGAILGNVLYDKFGRPHESATEMPHAHGGVPHQQGAWPPADAASVAGGSALPPGENDDPAAGTGGTWADDGAAPDQAVGGEWGSPQPEAEAEAVGGEWGEPAAQTEDTAGGDWSGGEPVDQDADQGADWSEPPEESVDSGGDSGGDEDQGGSW